MAYATINVEGGLLSPDLLDRLAAGDPSAPGQTAAAFGLPKSARLQDRMQTAFSYAKTSWENFGYRLERSSETRTRITRQAMTQGLFEIFGFPRLQYQRSATEIGGASFHISHRVGDAESAVPVHIVGIDRKLDERGAERRSPHALTQDFLNRSEALWGVVCNGESVRLLRDSARVSKPAYLQFELGAMMDGGAYGEFALMYRLMHASRFPQDAERPHRCLLEDYYQQSIEEGGRVRDKLRDGVKRALEILGGALLANPRSDTLRQDVRSGRLSARAVYRQLLTLVYRLLFLMVAEERGLVSATDDAALQSVYSRYYGVSRLRERTERHIPADLHADLWEGLLQTFRAFRDERAARTLGVSPLNGDLFAERGCREIEAARVSNGELLKAVLELSTFDDGGVRRRVNYAHLDVEELGSVYESLLDYRPEMNSSPYGGGRPTFELAAGADRKQTGSYYTPPELVAELADSALAPVMDARLAAARTQKDKERALLSLRVCDPAAGSGHFLLAAARRIARELAKVRSGEEEPNPAEYRNAVRDVIRECIYAVDKNELAVDLCKVALWIEGHDAGKPLGFLDHHVKLGDSLVGVADFKALDAGIPDGAYKPVAGDDKAEARYYRNRNRRERAGQLLMNMSADQLTSSFAGEFSEFESIREDSPAQVNEKRCRYDDARAEGGRWWAVKTACDLWTYAFFAPIRKAGADEPDATPTTDAVRAAIKGGRANPRLSADANAASTSHTFFHWPLEFPKVFENGGGFDVVLGNPPWERVKLQEKEFFRERDREIAAARNKAERQRLIDALPETNPDLAKEFADAVHVSESTSRFACGGGRFPLAGRGDVNTYSIFAETARAIIAPDGAAGIIVPTGIATDNTTKFFFGDLVETRSLVSLYDFENREKVFPGIDSRIKFCLLTMSGKDKPSPQADFAFFLHGAEDLADAERKFTLAPADFALFNPNTRTCPIFRTRRDMEIARKMYARAGVFWREKRGGQTERNPWGVSLQAMFHMSSDANLFETFESLNNDGWTLNGNVFERGGERYLPLYEAKLFHQYDHRFATFEGANDRNLRLGKARNVTADAKADTEMAVLPRYWVDEKEVWKRLDRGRSDVNIITPAPSAQRPAPSAQRPAPSAQRPAPSARTMSRSGQSPEPPTSEQRPRRFCPSQVSARERSSEFGVEHGAEADHQLDQPKNPDSVRDSRRRAWQQGRGGSSARWLVPIRKTTSSTNERTVVCCVVARSGMSDRAPTIAVTDAESAALLLSALNSFALDFAARTSVGGTDLSFFMIRQLPVVEPSDFLDELTRGATYADFIIPRVLELTYTSWEVRSFAEDLGYYGPPFQWDEERRFIIKCELDAALFHLYGLDRDDVDYIMDTFPIVRRSDERAHGEYRTKRVILEIYDEMRRAPKRNAVYKPTERVGETWTT